MGAQTTYDSNPALGYAGTLDPNYPSATLTVKNVEASASIPFGKAVVFKTSSPSTDLDVLLPAAETDIVAGIVVKSDAYSRAWTDDDGTVHGQIDSTGVRAGALMVIARKGRMLVKAESAVVPSGRLWVRAVAGAGESLGALEDADDSTDMIDCTGQGMWMTTAAEDGLAWLEFDFTAEA